MIKCNEAKGLTFKKTLKDIMSYKDYQSQTI